MNYWLNLFSEKSWREFVQHGSQLSGFKASRWSIAERIQIGDILLCYMIRGRGFFGVTEVTDKPFYDSSPRWNGFDFATWIPLKVTLLLREDIGIYPPSLAEMSWIKGKSSTYWQGRVAGSPSQIDDRDGELIVTALNDLRQQ
ncbi:MAG: hypothetical protein OXG78_04080 [Chloroflexi bacterium]|nr:hypothetical protein [Chloroflexota bacterium]